MSNETTRTLLDIASINLLSQAIAKEVVKGQVTAHDDFVDEQVASWPEAFSRRVPKIGAKDLETDKVISGQERYEIARALRGEVAAHLVEVEKQATDRAEREERQAREIAEQLEQHRLTYEANMTAWRALAADAQRRGVMAPAEPPAPPKTHEDLLRLSNGHRYRM